MSRAWLRWWGLAGLLSLASAAAAEVGFDGYADALGSLDAQLSSTRAKLVQSRSQREQALAALAGIGPSAQTAREQLTRDARALYRVSRGGMLPLAGGMAALLGHASRVSRLERLVQRDLGALSSLGARQSALQKQAASLDAEIAHAEHQLSSLQQARAGAARERVVHSEFQQTFSAPAPARAGSEHAQYGLSVIGGTVAERFVEQRGNLALPISGPSSIQDATRVESDGPGLEFATGDGAAVRAAAGGRVAFSERYGSYGQMVIIEHGDRYYTVYGGLAHLEVQVGDDVSKSARLGSVSAGPLYFEVRRGNKTQDARAWLGL